MRAFFGVGRSAGTPFNAGSEEGPQPGDVVVAGTPVTYHPPHPAEVVLAHEVGRPENESVLATAEAAQAAQAAEAMVTHTSDQRLQIAQSLKSSLNQEFQPSICMLNTDQLCRHACDLATAPDWMKECYNTQQNFTWALAGFNVLLSSFFRSGIKTRQSLQEVTASVWSLIEQLLVDLFWISMSMSFFVRGDFLPLLTAAAAAAEEWWCLTPLSSMRPRSWCSRCPDGM